MDQIQKFIQRNFRRILAIGGICLSLIALSILLNKSPQGAVWMVTKVIPSGGKIVASDVHLLKADLTVDSNHFLRSSDPILGKYSTRALHPGDLIATMDITSENSNPTANFLPIGVAVNDLSSDLSVGDLVDIYIIPKDPTTLPAVVAHRVAIASIDQKSRSLGGSVGVTLSTTTSVATLIVSAEAAGRLVLARDSI